MSATEQVQELRQRLTEATSWAAHCRGEAQAAADKLISQPSVELVQARDQAKALAEVADLECERVRRALESAREVERQEGIRDLYGRHVSEVVEPAQEGDQLVREHLAGLESALAGQNGLRNKARSITGQLRALGEAEASLQLNVRVDREVQRRLEVLLTAYNQAMRPV